MATQVQFRRGTTAETSVFTGAVGEVTVDLNKDVCVVHDGSTQGGFPLMREDGTNMALSLGSVTNCAVKFVSDYNTGIISPGPDQIALVTNGVIRFSLDSSGAASFANNVSITGGLTVGGSISLSGVVTFAAGSAAAPSIAFTGDTNTGIYSPGANQIGFATDGIGQFVLDATGNATLLGHLSIASGKEYRVNGVKVLDATSLGSSVISSSLTSLGTVTTGTWQASAVTHGYGGTGHTTYTSGQLLIGKADGSLAKSTLTAGSNITITNGDGSISLSVQDGTTLQKGVVQLEDSTSSTSTTTAATPNSVKSAYDLANGALPKSGGTMTGAILGDDSTSASTPGYAFDGDPDTGLLRSGANEIALVTGGSVRLSADASGNINIPGNLTVQGSTTTIDSTTVLVKDKNIELGVVPTPTNSTADAGGITLKGSTDKTIQWLNATNAWTVSEHLDLASTKEYRINNVKVLDATSLGSTVVSSSLTSVGTIASGTWQGSTLATGYGGTGQTTYTAGQLLIGKNDGTLAKATLTASTGVTITNGDGTITISAHGSGGTITAVTATSPLASTGGTAPDISIQDGTTTQKGAVQLEDSTSSTSTTKAATPNSVKTAYDLANAALPKAGGTLTGDVTLNAQSDLRFADADSSNWVAFQAPSTITSNVTWTLPNADGTAGQVLSTNGSGTLSWSAGGGGGASVTTSDTPPVSPTDGDLWYDSASGRMYVYYDDGTTSQWVDASPQGLISVVTSDTAPSSPTDGTFWYDSVGGRTYIYYNDGTTSQWVDASPQQTGPQTSIVSGNTSAVVTDTGSDGRFVVITEGTERFRINSSGNAGFGTTTPGSTVDVKGTLRLSGSSSGYVGLAPAAAAGSTTYTLPTADGTSGQLLSTDGSGTLSWTTPASFSRSKAYFYAGF